MPLDLQPHFLRVLEEGEIYRLGEVKPRKIKFRLIAATNRSLRTEVAEGRFRMDLFYRIAVASINIPPAAECPPAGVNRPAPLRGLSLHRDQNRCQQTVHSRQAGADGSGSPNRADR